MVGQFQKPLKVLQIFTKVSPMPLSIVSINPSRASLIQEVCDSRCCVKGFTGRYFGYLFFILAVEKLNQISGILPAPKVGFKIHLLIHWYQSMPISPGSGHIF